MNEEQLNTVSPLCPFLNGMAEVHFEPHSEDFERYAVLAAVMKRLRSRCVLGNRCLKRPEKGVVMRYLERTTGYSRQ